MTRPGYGSLVYLDPRSGKYKLCGFNKFDRAVRWLGCRLRILKLAHFHEYKMKVHGVVQYVNGPHMELMINGKVEKVQRQPWEHR